MNEIIDALSARIKAPYFGYALLVFIGLNWRAIFLLITTDGSPHDRLAEFDSYTNAWNLAFFPLLIGGLIAVASPWIRLAFSLISRRPFGHMDTILLTSEHIKTIKKTELEQARSKLFANKEAELIDRAKRDEAVLEIEDETLKAKLKQEIDALRLERDNMSRDLKKSSSTHMLSSEETEILKAAAKDGKGTISKNEYLSGRNIQAGSLTFGEGGNRKFMKYDAALNSLLSKGLVSSVGHKGQIFELTDAGWQLVDSL